MKPLRVSTESSQPIISAADFKLIFHRADELFTIHKDFIIALEPRIANWTDGQVIGDLFLMIVSCFIFVLNNLTARKLYGTNQCI